MKKLADNIIKLIGYLTLNFLSYVVFPIMVITIIGVIIYIVAGSIKMSDVREKGVFACGKVIRKDRFYEGKYLVDYEYYVDKKRYTDFLRYRPGDIESININDCMKVYFYPEEPNNHVVPNKPITNCDCR